MRTAALLLVLLAVGCTSLPKSSQTRMSWTDGQRKFEWISPKDYTVGSLTLDPSTGTFAVSNLSAQVDQAAVQAARDARIADSQATASAMNRAFGIAEAALKVTAP